MKSIFHAVSLFVVAILASACAGEHDRFYTLSGPPDDARNGPTAPTIHVILSVTLPALVDRAEMVLGPSENGITVLDHERWAAPLADEVTHTLARDIEHGRVDILVGDRGFDQGDSQPVIIKVDIVRMMVRRAGTALIEAHWRIVDANAGTDVLGGDLFTNAVNGEEYAAIAKAYSQVLGALAARLAAAVHTR